MNQRGKTKTEKKKASKKSSSNSSQTMEELIKTTGYQFKGLKKGHEVEGIITNITRKAVLVDIGAKTEGVVLSNEMEDARDYIDSLKAGDTIKTIVYSPENDKGQILLSLRQSAEGYKWDLFDQYIKTGESVDVRGLEVNKGGLIARLMGVRGFVPASQFGYNWLGKLDELQNKIIRVKVIEVDKEKNRLIFSEKAVSEAAALAKKQTALKKVKVNKEYSGVVSGVMPFGIFVRTEIEKGVFLEGLVHISEVSWEKVDNLGSIYRAGQKLKVKVLGINKDTSKLNLSVKQLTDDPWASLVKKYPTDKKVKGKVTRLASFGAFIELEPGVEGLIHISKIPADYDIKVGIKVETYIESVEADKRRLSLGLVLKEKPVGYK